MRHLSAALVTIACMVPMVMGDLGMFNAEDAQAYDVLASIALGAFLTMCLFDRPRREPTEGDQP